MGGRFLAPKWPNNSPELSKIALKCPKMAPRWALRGFRNERPLSNPEVTQQGTKVAPDSAKVIQDGAKDQPKEVLETGAPQSDMHNAFGQNFTVQPESLQAHFVPCGPLHFFDCLGVFRPARDSFDVSFAPKQP